FPLIATGGKKDETILQVIEAGANAVSFTPPTTGELFKPIMEKYRSE
ncbi:MAG: hydrolase, partial [Pyrinomonadaceae bacterium]